MARFLRFPAGIIVLAFFLSGGGCPSDTSSGIERARFAIDKCDPSDTNANSFCQTAIDEAEAILLLEPNNVEAAMLASSGYLGLAGIDFLQFAGKLIEAQNTTDADFKEFRNLVTDVESTNNRTVDLDRLRTSITTLETAINGLPTTTDLNKRAYFQLGTVQAMETFIVPVKLITIAADNTIDPSNITDETATILEQNFINGDDNLLASGTDDAETLSAMREGYCRCQKSRFGYGAACIRDLMACELSTTDTEDTEQDYDADGVVAGDREDDCESLVNPPGVADCKSKNTTD